jgi:hypothetical protein
VNYSISESIYLIYSISTKCISGASFTALFAGRSSGHTFASMHNENTTKHVSATTVPDQRAWRVTRQSTVGVSVSAAQTTFVSNMIPDVVPSMHAATAISAKTRSTDILLLLLIP